MSELDPNRWEQVFDKRRRQPLDVGSIPFGPRDRLPEVSLFIRAAIWCESAGVVALERKAAEAGGAAGDRIADHAREEKDHVSLLRGLLDSATDWKPVGPIRWGERILAHDRPLPQQLLATLIVESLGIAVYTMAAEGLGAGRVAAALTSIADDERIHLDFTRELLAALVPDLSRVGRVRLSRLRSRFVLAVVVAHTFGHARYLAPVCRLGTARARRRILDEIERSLAGVDLLAS